MNLRKCILLAALCYCLGTRTPDKGINLPPTQGTTRDGAFFPGLYQYAYQPDIVARATSLAGFTALRLAVNVETAHDMPSLQRHKAYLDAMGGHGVICMFDTSSTPGASWPRTGRITDKLDKVAQAWQSVHSVFSSYGESVMYEIFNEPWGYEGNAYAYLADMRKVIGLAGLPSDRVILAGLYGSADVRSVALAGWTGYLAYHTYVFWLPEGQRTQEGFTQKMQQDLAGLSSRVFITEFGVGLDGMQNDIIKYEKNHDLHSYNANASSHVGDWMHERPASFDVKGMCDEYPNNKWCQKHTRVSSLMQNPNIGADVSAHDESVPKADPSTLVADPVAAYRNDTNAFLRGMREALLFFKRNGEGVRGLYHWHGWHNSDAWDFWDERNAVSSRIIQSMMSDLGDGKAYDVDVDRSDLFMSDDYVHDEQMVNIVSAHKLGRATSKACPVECTNVHCESGNIAEIGGKAMQWSAMVNQVCTFNASAPFGGKRYCGAGVRYDDAGAIDCSGCAHPARCGALPCWGMKPSPSDHPSRARNAQFLQKASTELGGSSLQP